jgi:hypothetical protein
MQCDPEKRIVTARSEITPQTIHAILLDWKKRLIVCFGMNNGCIKNIVT